MDDDKGTSVALIHSDKGRHMWDSVKNHLSYKAVLVDQTSQQNLSILCSSESNAKRTAVLEKIRKEGFTEELADNNALLPSFRTKIIRKLKRIRK